MMVNLLYILVLTGFFLPDDVPSFKGGRAELDQFIDQNKIYPDFSRNNCIEGTIEVSFQLDAAGKVNNAKVYKGLGVDLDKEALRLIKLTSGKWENLTENNNNTLIIPINFSLQNYNCERVSSEIIKRSIEAYKVKEGLENAVVNYYKSKEKGEKSDKSEAEINRLKVDLGFDGDFIQQKLDEARKRLKQGDKAGACESLNFIKYIGSDAADKLIVEYCN